MMRIIAGEFKGHPIKAPKGDGTRPTTDRVRESLISSVNSILGGFEDARVLDLFAGSGALGGAVARGAERMLLREAPSGDRGALVEPQACGKVARANREGRRLQEAAPGGGTIQPALPGPALCRPRR